MSLPCTDLIDLLFFHMRYFDRSTTLSALLGAVVGGGVYHHVRKRRIRDRNALDYQKHVSSLVMQGSGAIVSALRSGDPVQQGAALDAFTAAAHSATPVFVAEVLSSEHLFDAIFHSTAAANSRTSALISIMNFDGGTELVWTRYRTEYISLFASPVIAPSHSMLLLAPFVESPAISSFVQNGAVAAIERGFHDTDAFSAAWFLVSQLIRYRHLRGSLLPLARFSITGLKKKGKNGSLSHRSHILSFVIELLGDPAHARQVPVYQLVPVVLKMTHRLRSIDEDLSLLGLCFQCLAVSLSTFPALLHRVGKAMTQKPVFWDLETTPLVGNARFQYCSSLLTVLGTSMDKSYIPCWLWDSLPKLCERDPVLLSIGTRLAAVCIMILRSLPDGLLVVVEFGLNSVTQQVLLQALNAYGALQSAHPAVASEIQLRTDIDALANLISSKGAQAEAVLARIGAKPVESARVPTHIERQFSGVWLQFAQGFVCVPPGFVHDTHAAEAAIGGITLEATSCLGSHFTLCLHSMMIDASDYVRDASVSVFEQNGFELVRETCSRRANLERIDCVFQKDDELRSQTLVIDHLDANLYTLECAGVDGGIEELSAFSNEIVNRLYVAGLR